MQQSSVAIYQELVPGISNVTLRMRYYGFYAWLAYRYAKDVRDTSVEVWCMYVRRAEALYALAAQYNGGVRGVAGSRWATRTLERTHGKRITFYLNTDRGDGETQYLKQKFGAFGAAYGSQLAEIGVLDKTHQHEVPVPAAGTGDALARAYEAAAGEAASVFLNAAKSGRVTKEQLTQMERMLPTRIAKSGRERRLYEDILFGKGHSVDSTACTRSLTLKLLLRVAAELGRIPSTEEARWALYSSHTDSGTPWEVVSPTEQRQQSAWKTYQANDLVHLCYEAILKISLDILETQPSGLPMNQLVGSVVTRLSKALGRKPISWQTLVDSVSVVTNAWDQEKPLSDYILMKKVLEASNLPAVCSDDCGASALKLLAVLHKRFGGQLVAISKQLPVAVTSANNHSLVTELQFLATHAEEPFEDFLTQVVRSRVLERHLWVALHKLRGQGDYTFLLEADEGRVRLRAKDGPVLTNPRLDSAITFLQDTHLLGEYGPTDAGNRVLAGP
ncbi:MAG: hypothetical protein KIT63_02485 [Rhodoferax sp.]|nr:hypothetical protein [Rhodoferax sp.]